METGKSEASGTEREAGDNGVGGTSPRPDGSGGAASHANDDRPAARRFDWRARVRRHPYGMLATAAGVGYLLGGGLCSRTTVRLLGFAVRLGARLAALPVIGDALIGMVGRGTLPASTTRSQEGESS